jgi:hypothetical protein
MVNRTPVEPSELGIADRESIEAMSRDADSDATLLLISNATPNS